MNIISIIIIALLCVAVVFAILSIRKNKGKCSGNCEGCSMNCDKRK